MNAAALKAAWPGAAKYAHRKVQAAARAEAGRAGEEPRGESVTMWRRVK